jgi:hypothetical protein
MSDTPISDRDRDLAELAASFHPDAMLGILAGMADTGATVTVGLLVNGMTIYGRTARRKEVAKALDKENVGIGRRGRAGGGVGWAEAEEKLNGLWTRGVEEDEAEDRLLAEHITGGFKDVPEQVARMIISGS